MAEHEETENGLIGKILGLSRKPWVCITAAAAGVVSGLYFKPFANALAPIGSIYITLLTMTVTPIIFCALASGISKLFMSANGRRYAGRIAATLLCGTAIAGFLGVFAGGLIMPFLTGLQDRDFVGETLRQFEESGANGVNLEASPGFWGFIGNFIPSNIIDALASENLLAVVFLAGLMGLAICEISGTKRELTVNFIDAVYETFLTVLEWILYLLPPGLFCLMASQVAKVGGETIKAMLAIIAIYIVCFLFMGCLYAILLKRSTGRRFGEIWAVMKEPYTIAFVASADSALPITMERMAKFGYPKEMLTSAIPLSAAMNRHATAIIFGLTTIFIANIYDVELTPWNYLFIAVACSIVGAFDSGEYVTIAPMISYILLPLDLPAATGVAVLLTIWPMIEWLPELQTIMAASANAAIAGNISKKSES